MFEFIAGCIVGGLVVSAVSYAGTILIERYFGEEK